VTAAQRRALARGRHVFTREERERGRAAMSTALRPKRLPLPDEIPGCLASREVVRLVLDYYVVGLPWAAIAARTGVGYSTIQKILRAAGVKQTKASPVRHPEPVRLRCFRCGGIARSAAGHASCRPLGLLQGVA